MLEESTELRDHLEDITVGYRKALVDNGFDVTEVIPSWSATTPGDSFVRVELRARTERTNSRNSIPSVPP